MRRTSLAAALTLTLFTASAEAQQDNPAAADALLEQGVALMVAGDFARACPIVLSSYRARPRPGVLFTLAECEARRGRIATADANYREFLSQVERLDEAERQRQREREVAAREQRAALAPRIPRLRLVPGKGAPRDGVVSLDGVDLGNGSLEISLPVDPGEHEVLSRAAARSEQRHKVRLEEGQTLDVTIFEGPPPPKAPPSPPQEGTRRISSGAPAWAFVALGVAGAAIVTGGIAGALTFGEKGAIDKGCDEKKRCDPAGLAAAERGQRAALVSDVAFAVGGVALAVGGIGVIWGGGSSPRTATIGVRTLW